MVWPFDRKKDGDKPADPKDAPVGNGIAECGKQVIGNAMKNRAEMLAAMENGQEYKAPEVSAGSQCKM